MESEENMRGKKAEFTQRSTFIPSVNGKAIRINNYLTILKSNNGIPYNLRT